MVGLGLWLKKDIKKNLVYLANGYEPEQVYKTVFEVGEIHLINPDMPIPEGDIHVKIRHGVAMHPCKVEGQRVHLKEPVHGVAAGQFAVFYAGNTCLGSAMIAVS